jgi:hypothetical protein
VAEEDARKNLTRAFFDSLFIFLNDEKENPEENLFSPFMRMSHHRQWLQK